MGVPANKNTLSTDGKTIDMNKLVKMLQDIQYQLRELDDKIISLEYKIRTLEQNS